jgi:hypothetical protein
VKTIAARASGGFCPSMGQLGRNCDPNFILFTKRSKDKMQMRDVISRIYLPELVITTEVFFGH